MNHTGLWGGNVVVDKPGGRGHFIDCFNDVKKGLRIGRYPKIKYLVLNVL